jgi:hypothetical protein
VLPVQVILVSAALTFGMEEDFGLFVVGTLATTFLIGRDLMPKMEKVL